MAYDPNINFYDNPGHPYWPSSGNWHEDGVVPSGGGGDAELGELVRLDSIFPVIQAPVVGNDIQWADIMVEQISLGDTVLVEDSNDGLNVSNSIAAGVTVTCHLYSGDSSVNIDTENPVFYIVTVNANSQTYETVRALDMDYQQIYPDDQSFVKMSFTMPDIDEEERLAIVVTPQD